MQDFPMDKPQGKQNLEIMLKSLETAPQAAAPLQQEAEAVLQCVEQLAVRVAAADRQSSAQSRNSEQ